MDMMQLATKLLNDKLGLQLDSATVQSALSGLLGDGQGGIDLASLAAKMTQNGDLGSLLGSWLGDGANMAISPDSIQSLLGRDSVDKFASQLGVDPADASQGLASMLPQLMDQSSSGGSLLDAAGGLGGLMGAARSFLS
jgi:uncharacterized protein YidB (DUF937 family)